MDEKLDQELETKETDKVEDNKDEVVFTKEDVSFLQKMKSFFLGEDKQEEKDKEDKENKEDKTETEKPSETPVKKENEGDKKEEVVISKEQAMETLGLTDKHVELLKKMEEEENKKELKDYISEQLKDKSYTIPETITFESKEQFDFSIQLVEAVLNSDEFVKKSEVKETRIGGVNKGQITPNRDFDKEYREAIKNLDTEKALQILNEKRKYQN